MNINQFLQKKKWCDDLQRQADKADARKETLLEQLRKEYGCETLKEAKEKIVLLTKRIERLEKEYDVKDKEFTDEFGDRIQGL